MELPSSCFIYPYFFILIFIIIHIVIYFLIIKFINHVEKLAFVWGMINWSIAIGAIYFGIMNIFNFETNSDGQKILKALISGIIPPITEDVGRFIVFTFIYKSKNHNFNNSLIFGAGHGGWESIVLMSITQIENLMKFYAIKNAKDEEELEKNNLIKIYQLYKDGIANEEIFRIIIRFLGNLFHMGASVIIYRLSLNRKERKFIIFFTILFIFHFIIDSFGQFISLYELNIWYNLVFIGLDVAIVIIGYFVWKENTNKEFSDYNFENNESIIQMGNVPDNND